MDVKQAARRPAADGVDARIWGWTERVAVTAASAAAASGELRTIGRATRRDWWRSPVRDVPQDVAAESTAAAVAAVKAAGDEG